MQPHNKDFYRYKNLGNEWPIHGRFPYQNNTQYCIMPNNLHSLHRCTWQNSDGHFQNYLGTDIPSQSKTIFLIYPQQTLEIS